MKHNSLIFIFLFAMSITSRISAIDYQVYNNSSDPTTTHSLPWAVRQAESNPGSDRVYINIPQPNTYFLFGEFIITDTLEIIAPVSAPFHIVNSDCSSPIFSLYNTHVKLRNITMGVASQCTSQFILNGGLIYSERTNLELTGCKLSSGKVLAEGGAVYSEDGLLTINNCVFQYCESYTNGGAIYNTKGPLTIHNSVFHDNGTRYGSGGAIFHYGKIHNNLFISGTSIYRNSANADNLSIGNGGGISCLNAFVEIINSTISNNQSDELGGGVYLLQCDSGLFRNCNIKSNKATDGAGIYLSEVSLKIHNSTFNDNVATIRGGGIGALLSNLAIVNSTFGDNVATQGGAIAFIDQSTNFITNSTLIKNEASANGGAISNNGSSVSIDNCLIGGNSAPNGPDLHGTFDSQYGHYYVQDPNGAAFTGNTSGRILGVPFTDLVDVNLANNGGPTSTYNLLSTSPAINAGANIPGINTDQRGFGRSDGMVDMGAVEYAAPCLPDMDNILLCEGQCKALTPPGGLLIRRCYSWKWYRIDTVRVQVLWPVPSVTTRVVTLNIGNGPSLCVSPSSTQTYRLVGQYNCNTEPNCNTRYSSTFTVNVLPQNHPDCLAGNYTGDNCCEKGKIATSIAEPSVSETASFEVFPNPNNGSFSISVSDDISVDDIDANLSVVSFSGQVVYHTTTRISGGKSISIDLNNLESGIYLVQLKAKDFVWNKRMIIN